MNLIKFTTLESYNPMHETPVVHKTKSGKNAYGYLIVVEDYTEQDTFGTFLRHVPLIVPPALDNSDAIMHGVQILLPNRKLKFHSKLIEVT